MLQLPLSELSSQGGIAAFLELHRVDFRRAVMTPRFPLCLHRALFLLAGNWPHKEFHLVCTVRFRLAFASELCRGGRTSALGRYGLRPKTTVGHFRDLGRHLAVSGGVNP